MWNFDGPFGGHQTQTQENPLQWLLRINQEKGGAVLDALGNIPKVIQEIPGRIQQGAGNLLKIGQDSLDQVVKTSIEQQEQRKANLEAGGVSELKQRLSYNAEALAEAATGAGWLDLAGVGLMEASGADWVPQNLKLPLLVGGMAVSAADGTPSPLSPKQLGRLSEISSAAKKARSGIVGTATSYNPRRKALTEYKRLLEDGFDMSGDKDIQRLLAQTVENSVDKLPTNVKQWDNKALYIEATKEHIAKYGAVAGKTMREEVGVFVDPKTKEIFQVMKRGNKNLSSDWQLRRGSEATNTNLNRALDTFLQSPGYESYKSIANKERMMEQIGFVGTKQEFQKKFEIHHVNAIKVYSPFFVGLKPKQAEELRKLAEGAKIYLGNDPRNLVPLLKRKHTLDTDSIHTFLRENGIEGSSKWPFLSTAGNKLGSYNPQARMATLLEGRSVQERFEVMKGFKEWVQDPANDHLNRLLEAERLGNINPQ